MDLGLLQAGAARRVGTRVGTYQLWERDAAVPTAPGMGKVVVFLGFDPTPLPGDFPGRLTVLRRRVGLTQARFARKVRVDPCTVSSWEQGITTPPAPFWRRIIRALGIDPTSPADSLANHRRLGARPVPAAAKAGGGGRGAPSHPGMR